MTRSRHWSVTINNPTITLDEYRSLCEQALGASALRAQLERGESGTPHIQSHISFKDAKTFATLKKRLPPGAHIETSIAPVESWAYCGKEDTRVEGPVEFGEAPKPRKNVKGDTAAFNKLALSIGPEKMVESGQLSIMQYHKLKTNISTFKLHTAIQPTLGDLHNRWIYGPTGTGKSRHVRESYGDSLFDKPCNKWWDGYQNEDTVLLDDFGKEHAVLGHYLKRWADHYPFKVEIKGLVSEARPQRIVVTSNYHPSEIWQDN